jgi:hypothetical protein
MLHTERGELNKHLGTVLSLDGKKKLCAYCMTTEIVSRQLLEC